ncbi:MAG TPA: hypothetical protein V6D47_12195, partial [Oscillatoriaceae cyanobacterium]
DQLTNRHAVVRRRHGVSFLGLHNRKEPWRRLLFKVRRFLHHPTGRYPLESRCRELAHEDKMGFYIRACLE